MHSGLKCSDNHTNASQYLIFNQIQLLFYEVLKIALMVNCAFANKALSEV